MFYNFQGRGFNVQINFAEEPVQDYVQAAVSTVLLIHERVFCLHWDRTIFINLFYFLGI